MSDGIFGGTTDAPPSAPKPKRKCSVCGETGHTARRHGGTTAKPSGGKKSSRDTRARNIYDFLTIPVAVLGMAGQMGGSKPLVADAVVISQSSPAIADSVAGLAEQDERIAAVVDKLVQAGPYAAVFGAVLPVVIQVVANHNQRLASAGKFLGLRTVDEIIDSAESAPDAPDVQPEGQAVPDAA